MWKMKIKIYEGLARFYHAVGNEQKANLYILKAGEAAMDAFRKLVER